MSPSCEETYRLKADAWPLACLIGFLSLATGALASSSDQYTLVVEDIIFGKFTIVTHAESSRAELDSESLLDALSYWLKPEVLDQLKSRVRFGMLTVDDLSAVGVSAKCDGSEKRVAIQVPAAVRRSSAPDGGSQDGENKVPTSDDLFEMVFKKKRPVPPVMKVGLMVEDERGPEVTIQPNDNSALIQVEALPVLRILASWIPEDAMARLSRVVEGGMISFRALREVGLIPRFDDPSLKVAIQVPLRSQRVRVRSLMGRIEGSGLDDLIAPSFLSGFVNVDASKVFQTGSVTGSSFGGNAFNTDLDGVINAGSFVLEAEAAYNQLNTTPWRRGNVSLTKDIPPLMLRTTAGDLSLPVWGYERSVPMGGVGVSTAFGTQPNVLVTALSHQEIVLKTPATVNFYRNGVLLQTVSLKEGKYDLRDLPVVTGPNDLVIEVIDAAGRRETLNLSQYYNAGFLAPGLSQFSYDVGLPSKQVGSYLAYDSTSPTVFLSHRLGITTELTAGIFYEHQPLQTVAGGTALFPLLRGMIQADVAASRTDASGFPEFGGALKAYYSYIGQVGGTRHGLRSLGLGVERRTPSFTLFGDNPTQEPFLWNFFGTYTEPLSQKFSASIGANYSLLAYEPQGESDRAMSFHLSGNRAFDRGTSGTVTLSYNNSPGQVEVSAAVYLSWSFPESQQLLSAAYDSQSSRTSIAWNQNSNTTVGSTRSGVELDNDPNTRDVVGSLSYFGNRGELSLQEDFNDLRGTTSSGDPTDSITSVTRVTASGALVFAGGAFALGQKVSDSFAIIKPGPAQRGEPIEVNPLGDGTYFAQTDWMGAAALTNLGSYQKNDIRLGGAQLTEDSTLPATHYRARPTYKSGVLISLDTGFNVVIRGRMLGADGKPLARVSGEIVELQGSPPRSLSFFTNRAGLFQIEGLRPGKYEIRFYDEIHKSLPIEIPEKSVGLRDLGKLEISSLPGAKDVKESGP